MMDEPSGYRRVFEIAKELSTGSKVIVDTCHSKGISREIIKNHLSVVTPDLELRIRTWLGSREDEKGE